MAIRRPTPRRPNRHTISSTTRRPLSGGISLPLGYRRCCGESDRRGPGLSNLEIRHIGNRSKLDCEILTGDALHAWLDLPENRKDWEALYRACPWRFPTLLPDYYRLWIAHYGTLWPPLLIVIREASGRLAGLFPLGKKDRLITGAGAQQAEYHGWLSAPEQVLETFRQAQGALAASFPGTHLRFRYLPPAFPSAALAAIEGSLSRLRTQTHRRPLLRLDPARLKRTLAKKGNRSRLNQLKRRGELSCKRLTDRHEIESCLDELALWYDLRQGAVNDTCPFTDDPHKKAFTLAWLLGEATEHLHLSCLRVGGQFVAGHLGVMERGFCQLAVLGQSTRFAGCSPGKLQIYLTAQLLADTGQEFLDLTPGDDRWKERFATEHDQVLSLELYPDRYRAIGARLRRKTEELARGLLRWLGVSPDTIRRLIARPASDPTPPQPYRLSVSTGNRNLPMRETLPSNMVNSGRIEDLLRFRPSSGGMTRQRFLQRALENLESGGKVYTIMDDNQLKCCAWLHERRSDDGHAGPVLRDIFAASAPPGCLAALIGRALQDSAADGGPLIVELSPDLAQNLRMQHAGEFDLLPLAAGDIAG